MFKKNNNNEMLPPCLEQYFIQKCLTNDLLLSHQISPSFDHNFHISYGQICCHGPDEESFNSPVFTTFSEEVGIHGLNGKCYRAIKF